MVEFEDAIVGKLLFVLAIQGEHVGNVAFVRGDFVVNECLRIGAKIG